MPSVLRAFLSQAIRFTLENQGTSFLPSPGDKISNRKGWITKSWWWWFYSWLQFGFLLLSIRFLPLASLSVLYSCITVPTTTEHNSVRELELPPSKMLKFMLKLPFILANLCYIGMFVTLISWIKLKLMLTISYPLPGFLFRTMMTCFL